MPRRRRGREKDEAVALVAEQRENVQDASDLIRSVDRSLRHDAERRRQVELAQTSSPRTTYYRTNTTTYSAIGTSSSSSTTPSSHPSTATSAVRHKPAMPNATTCSKRHKRGQSLRSIAEDTELSFQAVRTIIDKKDGVDRATLARLERIAPDRIAKAYERARRKTRKYLPARINALLEKAADLDKRAKGLK